MANKKPHFNRQEKAILKVLFTERRYMSINEIADKSHMSWVTARKHLKRLKERGAILCQEKKFKKRQ